MVSIIHPAGRGGSPSRPFECSRSGPPSLWASYVSPLPTWAWDTSGELLARWQAAKQRKRAQKETGISEQAGVWGMRPSVSGLFCLRGRGAIYRALLFRRARRSHAPTLGSPCGELVWVGPTILGRQRSSRDARPYLCQVVAGSGWRLGALRDSGCDVIASHPRAADHPWSALP